MLTPQPSLAKGRIATRATPPAHNFKSTPDFFSRPYGHVMAALGPVRECAPDCKLGTLAALPRRCGAHGNAALGGHRSSTQSEGWARSHSPSERTWQTKHSRGTSFRSTAQLGPPPPTGMSALGGGEQHRLGTQLGEATLAPQLASAPSGAQAVASKVR